MRVTALADNPWVYQVTYVNAKDERHVVTVQLTELERRGTFYPGHTGGPNGPIANLYVCRHADRLVPPEFKPVREEIRRITQANVRALR